MKKVLFFFFFIVFVISCGPRQISVPLSFNRQTECVSQNPGGTIVIKSWGSGENRSASKFNAITIGLRDILFNGINKGKADCYTNPIVPSLAAKKEYEPYFYDFFNNSSEINKYIEVTETSNLVNTNNTKTISVVMIVNTYELKNKIFRDLKINQ